MIFGDDQYLHADLMEDESVVIKPTLEFRELINSLVRDVDMLHDKVFDLNDEIRELKQKSKREEMDD